MKNVTVALGQTLIHSLWQGVLLAGLTGLIILLTRSTKAANRYILMVGAMSLFTLITIATFCYELYQPTLASVTTEIAYRTSLITTSTVVKPGLLQPVIQYVNDQNQTIVLVWVFIVLARSLQLASGLQGLHHLRRKNLFCVDEIWAKRVGVLATGFGIKRIVGIAESGIAKVPMVIGHLKPMILIPAGLFTALPPAEIEAILIHELAHIKRRDYLVNMLQSFLEIIFFFNPAVLWLSDLISAERENCCDDIAIEQTSSKVNYIKALVSCQQFQLSAPDYAMAFVGRRSQLVDRVKRMASGNNHALNFRERSILFVVLLAAGLLTAAFTNAKQIQHFALKAQKVITHSIVPQADTIHVQQSKKSAKKIKVRSNTTVWETKGNTEETEVIEPKEIQLRQQKELAFADSMRQSHLAPIKPINTRTEPLAPLSGRLTPLNSNATYTPAKLNMIKAVGTYKSDYKPYSPGTVSIGAQVTAELIKDRLIMADDKKVSFKLSDDELIVNGIPEPEEIQKQYKAKFVPVSKGKGTWTLYNNYDTDATVKP